jgi:imidazolonepropionase-like amidohydrolase
MNAECIKLMVEKGIYWCPTIYVNEWVADGRAAVGSMMNKVFTQTLPATFNKALKAGVKIALGTDAGGFDWTENEAKDLSYMVKWGMTARYDRQDRGDITRRVRRHCRYE